MVSSMMEAKFSNDEHNRAEADSRLVKSVVMTNIFFSNQQHEIKIKLFICVKIKSSFFSNN